VSLETENGHIIANTWSGLRARLSEVNGHHIDSFYTK